ncbi:MAG: HupU protein [Betaproteobacteria bacterium]|nr:HupU protein [Betaproteobacteria bacterium]
MNLLWLQSGGCGGCSMSLLGADTRDFFATLEDVGVKIVWHPALSEISGREMIELLQACAEGKIPLDMLCIEGALLRGPHGSGRFHMLAGTAQPMIDWIIRLAQSARYVLAIGSCAAWGGVTSAGINPTDACGLQYDGEVAGGLLGSSWRSSYGLPVINVAGCPTHPGWILDTLAALANSEFNTFGAEDLDGLGRPRFYADQLVHTGCSRNEFYEFKASAEKASDMGCLMENLGCKGTQAHADCNTRLWHGNSSCLRGGFACINCTEPGFEEPGHAFASTPKVAGIPIGLPTDMPKAWFVALAALSKSATPRRVRENATADHQRVTPAVHKPANKSRPK